VGSKWSFSALVRFMREHYGEDKTNSVQEEMKSVIVKTLIAADDDINTSMSAHVSNPDSCFELFGFDLILDRKLRVWLVEVNISPSLMTASPLDKKVKTILVCDTLHLVGIPQPVSAKVSNLRSDVASSEASSTSSFASLTTGGRKRSSLGSKPKHVKEHSRNVLNLAKRTWVGLPSEDKAIVEKAITEKRRSGHFERIFPPENNPKKHEEYLRLFTSRRYANALLQKFESKVEQSLSKPIKKKKASSGDRTI